MTTERLGQLYNFDSDVLERVEQEVRRQQDLSWPEYRRRYDIPDPTIFKPLDGEPIEVLDIAPQDYGEVLIYHQPMGCVLDSEIMLHAATMAAVNPHTRLIAVGNPGQPGHGYGKLKLNDLFTVWKGNFRPAVAPVLEYLNNESLESVIHAGESYGSHKAATAAEYSYDYDTETTQLIMVEPVSIIKRGLARMATTFGSTNRHAKDYIGPLKEQSQTFVSAREAKESMAGYILGLGRLSNFAIGHGLGVPNFEFQLDQLLTDNPNLMAGIAWGAKSEFDKDNLRRVIVSELKTKYPGGVESIELPNETHAMNIDYFLSAALVAQLAETT